MTADEIENDLKRYFKFMMNSNVDGCISIEEKYGLFGASPEMVTTELKEAAQQLRAVDATPTSAADGESNNGVRH